jgi:serine/threonine-protein kinase HipA
MPDADIYQGPNRVAHFERVHQGLRLTYIDGVSLQNGFLATTLPQQEWVGQDLPPFFLNLLPEGARLRLLLERARSKDDSLDLLMKTGWDAIGDVAVLPQGQLPEQHHAALSSQSPHEVSFWELFYEGVSSSIDHSVPGVQEKISASTVAFGVRLANAPSAILKLNPEKYPRLVQNEEFFLRVARSCGIDVAQATIIHDKAGEPGLLVNRFDRVKRNRQMEKLHQEDACQLLGAVPAHKYDLSLRDIADAVAKACTSKMVEVERLLRLVAFSYLIGNCDLHAKNVSVLWDGVVRLSPAYDLLSTLPYPFLERRMALKIQGKDDNLRYGDFIDFGKRYELPEKALLEMIRSLCDHAEPWLGRLDEIGFDTNQTESLRREIQDRIQRLRR